MKKKIMAINSGSSSLKFQLFEMPAEKIVIKGVFERIGETKGSLSYVIGAEKETQQIKLADHRQAVTLLLELLIKKGVIHDFSEISGVGHRVAHGGEYFNKSTILGPTELAKIKEFSQLAPLHNPVNLLGIAAFQAVLPDVPPVGTFDTAFHQTLEPEHFIYPVPYDYYQRYGIRRYGFHGTSHQYVAQEGVRLKNLPLSSNIISCHLGNGASVCGIKEGRSVVTSMGFTPLSGLMMGTRSGDIDPSILAFIQQREAIDEAEMLHILNFQSGLLGISGVSNDYRLVQLAADEGNQRAQLALRLFTNRISQTIASYTADLGGLDLLLFTAGIGENSSSIRKAVCQRLSFLGIELDNEANLSHQRWIHSSQSKVMIGVIPTNEELVIARDTYQLMNDIK